MELLGPTTSNPQHIRKNKRAPGNLRYLRQFGKIWLTRSFTAPDPVRTYRLRIGDDDVDIATFAIFEWQLNKTLTDPFDVSTRWPLDGVVKPDASIQLIGYPENIRVINSIEKSAVFNAWGALDLIQDYNEREIILTYEPDKVLGAPTKPPLGYNMSGCSGGPAIVHELRASNLHVWYPVGLIVGGPRFGEGDAAAFDIIRVRRIDCIQADGHIRRETGWLPGR